jgi:hypothetical protein
VKSSPNSDIRTDHVSLGVRKRKRGLSPISVRAIA